MDVEKGGWNRAHPRMLQKMYLFMLWLIRRKEAHGYQIIQVLKKEGATPLGASRIYPLLNAMAHEGLILQKKRREGKRVRKVYLLTRKGSRMLAEGKRTFPPLLKEFLREMVMG